MDKNPLKANIWKYQVFTFLNMFFIFLPFIIYYFQELGFSLGKIAILQSAIYITILLVEIPSGYFADRFGRKVSLIAGVILELISLTILYSATNFTMLFLAHICSGLSIAFVSGADSAILYDSLISLKKQHLFKKVDGKAKFYGEIAIILAALIGTLVIKQGVHQTILYTIFAQVVLLAVVFSFREPKRHIPIEKLPMTKELTNLFSIIKKSLYNKKLLGLFSYSFIIMGVNNTIFVMYQPYFKATGLELPSFGLVFAIFSVVAGIIALKAHSIESKLGIYKSLILMPLFLVASLIGASTFFVWFGFMFFFLREMVRGYIFPIIGDYIHQLAVSNERATVTSINSMFSRVGLAVVSVTFGFFSDIHGLKPILLYMGLILLVFTIVIPLLLIFKKRNKKTKKFYSK